MIAMGKEGDKRVPFDPEMGKVAGLRPWEYLDGLCEKVGEFWRGMSEDQWANYISLQEETWGVVYGRGVGIQAKKIVVLMMKEKLETLLGMTISDREVREASERHRKALRDLSMESSGGFKPRYL